METSAVLTKTKWSVDHAHSEIGFRVKHLVVANVRGTFNEYDASIETNGDDFMSAKIDFWLNPASVDTHDEKRDGHVRSADFFDVEKFNRLTFTSDTCKKLSSDGHYELSGDLTIKGITKTIKLDIEYAGIVKDPWGNTKAAFTINGKINRKDYGLNWNAAVEAGGVLVSEDVWINCDIQLLKNA